MPDRYKKLACFEELEKRSDVPAKLASGWVPSAPFEVPLPLAHEEGRRDKMPPPDSAYVGMANLKEGHDGERLRERRGAVPADAY